MTRGAPRSASVVAATVVMAAAIVSPQSAVWTHEPAGLRGLADNAGDRDYDFVREDLDGTHPTRSGWYNPYPADYAQTRQLALITDPAAPFPTAVMQMMYPKGFSGGTAPGEAFYEHRTVTEYYIGFYFKISNPYQNVSSNHNKIMYIYTTGGRDLVLEFFGPEPFHLGMAEYVSSAGKEVDHYGSTPLALARWHKVELSISYATGIVRWWVDGVPDARFPAALSTTGGSGLNQTQMNPTYGGGGLPVKPYTDYVWYNHVRMSGSP